VSIKQAKRVQYRDQVETVSPCTYKGSQKRSAENSGREKLAHRIDDRIIYWLIFTFILWVAVRLEMKLLTHNMLTSNIIKGVKDGYPLKIKVR